MSAAAALLETPPLPAVLWRGALYELLAEALSYPDPPTRAAVRAALDDLLAHEESAAAGLQPLLEAVATGLAESTADALLAAHSSLFAGEVTCSACETEYDFDTFAKARQLADVAGFYRAFGLRVSAERPAPADQVANELQFMAQLALKRAYAAATGLVDAEALCIEAERSFIEDHLGRWLPAFCRDLGRFSAADAFYGAVAALCARFSESEVARVGAHPRPALGRKSQALEAEAFTCGLAAADPSAEEQP